MHLSAETSRWNVLQRLIEPVEDDRISLGARPNGKKVTGVEVEAEPREVPDTKPDEVTVRPAHEPSRAREYYVSYALG